MNSRVDGGGLRTDSGGRNWVCLGLFFLGLKSLVLHVNAFLKRVCGGRRMDLFFSFWIVWWVGLV